MKVLSGVDGFPAGLGPSVVAIGNFDGVHAGHRRILRRVSAIARERSLVPAVLTFDPHPARVLAPDRAPNLIGTISQRLGHMENEAVEVVVLLPFSLELARLTPEEFVRNIVVDALHARCVIVGDDFRFGHKQSGDLDQLRALGAKFGFEVESAGAILQRGERISSTAIRDLVKARRVSRACRMLGEPFSLEGAVVKGHGVGTKQTVPTLNLAPDNELMPGTGVYVTRARDLDSPRTWRSITNIGYRPTFGGDELTCETFLLDTFDGQTPARIEIAFLYFVREEKKFDTPELLRSQIMKDVGIANRLHGRLARLFAGKPGAHLLA